MYVCILTLVHGELIFEWIESKSKASKPTNDGDILVSTTRGSRTLCQL